MNDMLATILMLGAVSLLAMMLFQGFRGTVDIVSVRNVFLLGLIVFQFTSAAVTLRAERFVDLSIANLERAGVIYTFCLLLFTTIFLTAYGRGWFVKKLAGKVPVGSVVPGVSSTLTLAIAFLATGLLFRLVLIYIPILGVLTGIVGASIIAAGAGMAVWAYAPRLLNPIVGFITLAVVAVASLAAIHKTFGRRDLLSVLLCCMWAAFHSHWKHLSPPRAIFRLGVLGAGAMVLLAAFSAVRSGGEPGRSAGQMVSLMQGAAITEGVRDVLSGQLAGQNSMWIIENYPERYAYEPFFSAWYCITNPVPRAFWPDKPVGLGLRMVDQAGAGEGKGEEFTLGPGMIGHVWADHPFFSLIPYAVFLGLFCRFLDEMVRIHTWNPFVVLPIGTALGQIIGVPRGELGLFMFQAISGMIFAFAGMFLVARTMALFGWRIRPDDPVGAEEFEPLPEADDQEADRPEGGAAEDPPADSSARPV